MGIFRHNRAASSCMTAWTNCCLRMCGVLQNVRAWCRWSTFNMHKSIQNAQKVNPSSWGWPCPFVAVWCIVSISTVEKLPRSPRATGWISDAAPRRNASSGSKPLSGLVVTCVWPDSFDTLILVSCFKRVPKSLPRRRLWKIPLINSGVTIAIPMTMCKVNIRIPRVNGLMCHPTLNCILGCLPSVFVMPCYCVNRARNTFACYPKLLALSMRPPRKTANAEGLETNNLLLWHIKGIIMRNPLRTSSNHAFVKHLV